MKPISTIRKRITIVLTVVILMMLTLLAVVQQRLLVDLPRPDELYDYTSAPSTKIYDRHDRLLYEITDPHQGLHTPLTLEDVPASCIQATIATEDGSFYHNPGVDAWAIVRAMYINFRGGEILSGGSTITQQLARNLLLSPEERTEISLTRKLREAVLAWRLARTYSKDEILTLYLNETYYGNLAYGIEAASRTYFGKNAAELDLAECALLAGLPQSPATYNPLENLTAAKARQSIVLDLMLKEQFITTEQADSARREKLGFAAIPFPIEAPHFVMYIRGQLERLYGLEAIYRQGLEVHTTLDLDMQNTAQRFAQLHLAELAEQKDGEPPRVVRNAAVVVLDPQSGEVLAMLGSPDYFDPRIDGAVNATTALRQPGSSIKPITYAAAFDPNIAETYGYKPLTAASMMVDVRTSFVTQEGQPYAPENYDRTWRGPVLLRQSLASSFNLVAVKVLDYVGLEAMIDLSRAMGITTFDNKNFGLALTLGGGEVRLLELTAAYGAFANGGHRVEPVTIRRITDHAGTLIYETPKTLNPGPQVMDARTAYLITDILSDNYARRATFGAGSPLRLNRPAAAKTGTTQDWRDNWTIGYTPDMVVGVWVGNADNEPMRHVSGVTGAAPIWRDVTQQLLKTRPAHDFPQPSNLTEATVCSINGFLPRPDELSIDNLQLIINNSLSSQSPVSNLQSLNSQIPTSCPHTVTEIFIPGTEPQVFDTWHEAIAVDRRTGLRAGPGCSLEDVTLRTFTRYPAEAVEWAIKQGVPQPPDAYSPLCPGPDVEAKTKAETRGNDLEGGLVFVSPDQGTVLRLVPNIPFDKQKLRVKVRPANGVTVSDVSMLINGQPLTAGFETLWQMTPGRYTFEAIGLDSAGNEIVAAPVSIEVVR